MISPLLRALPFSVALGLAGGMISSLLAQDTNRFTTVLGEPPGEPALTDPAALRVFVHAPNPAARRAAAEASRQAVGQARQAAREEIEVLAEGAVARFGPHQVTFPTAMPASTILRTPDGLLLRGAVLGLAYVSDSGQSVLLAELKESEGELVEGKTVIYRDAFDDVSADLVYEYTRTSFEQLVVIRKQLPPPEEFGFSADENVRLAVLTEWFHPPEPRKATRIVSLRDAYQALGIPREENLVDETLSFGAMRMVEGKSFALGEPDLGVPTGKTWETLRGTEGEARQFLIEATPYRLLKPLLDALPVRTASLLPREPQSLHAALRRLKAPKEPSGPAVLMARADTAIDAEPGVVLDYLIVNTPLLNVEFAYAGKFGPAAAGYDPYDYWNPFDFEGYSAAGLANLSWSDWSQSSVGLVVSNAPGVGLNSFCLDPMYQYFIHPTNGGQITVTITNLPADVYDVFVYATRASEAGAPVIELLRNGTSLWKKATTYWGRNWYANPWDEHEQYVRFRKIAVTNQTLTLISYADAAGYASLSGLQIVPVDALPAEAPNIVKLLNLNFPGNTPDKVGFAAVGQTTNDFWNERPNATSGATTNLKLADSTTTGAGVIVRNASGNWGFVTVPDLMYQNYIYGGNGGNTTLTLTNLPSGTCDFYIYGHTTNYPDNAIFELWSDQVSWGAKGTSIHGPGPATTNWQVGQQFVLFKGVAVSSNAPVIIHAKHSTYGYQNINGLQIAYTGDYDSDADGLPDGWELKWLYSLDYSANDDPDADGLTNRREYQLALDPLRSDSDADGLADGVDNEFPWLEDASPQGCYQYTAGGDNWTWVSSWSDGVGWNGGTVTPHSGQKLRVSANTTNTIHQHYFERAVSVLRPGTGDVLYAWVNLDPTKPPTEVMLQFQTLGNNGAYGREHRAYWGANNIAYGTDGTVSRTNLGALPPAGQWVRLEVPASVLGLEGRIIEGINFTLHSGRAAWDSAGIVVPDMDGGTDSDGDGLPDWWELQYFGNLNQTGSGDYDSDGVSNLMEFLQGRKPLVGAVADSGDNTKLRVYTPLK